MRRVGPLCATAFVRMQVEIRETRLSVAVYGPGLYGNDEEKSQHERPTVPSSGYQRLFFALSSRPFFLPSGLAAPARQVGTT